MITAPHIERSIFLKNKPTVYENIDERISPQLYPKSDQMTIDLSKIDLDLDEVDAPADHVDLKSTLTLEPLSASKLQLLQDTTMIESALDLDSLEESTSSVGANSHAGLIRNKQTIWFDNVPKRALIRYLGFNSS